MIRKTISTTATIPPNMYHGVQSRSPVWLRVSFPLLASSVFPILISVRPNFRCLGMGDRHGVASFGHVSRGVGEIFQRRFQNTNLDMQFMGLLGDVEDPFR